MKKIALLVFCVGIFGAYAQAPAKRIRIILLGTFHFNQSLDSNSRLHFNPFEERRKKEIGQLVGKLAKQKPDKIFLEFSAKDQPFYDSIYADFLKEKQPERLRTRANEIVQIGMNTAKLLGHKKVLGINYQPQELSDSAYRPANAVDKAMQDLWTALGSFNDTTRTNGDFYDLPFPYRLPKADSLLQKSTLSEFLLYLNSKEKLQRDEYSNWNYYYSLGTGSDMSTMDYVGTFWYGSNVRNYNNVLRQVDPKKDRCYLILYGSSHIPFLKYLFQMNPYFEVVDLGSILK